MRYLLCPKCGIHRFYVKKDGKQIYFHVDFDGKLLPTAQSNADLSSLNPSEIEVSCAGCAWSGKVSRLVKAF